MILRFTDLNFDTAIGDLAIAIRLIRIDAVYFCFKEIGLADEFGGE